MVGSRVGLPGAAVGGETGVIVGASVGVGTGNTEGEPVGIADTGTADGMFVGADARVPPPPQAQHISFAVKSSSSYPPHQGGYVA